MAARARDALGCNRLEEVGFVTVAILRKQGIAAADLEPRAVAQARQAMLRAGIDVAEALKARYEGDFNFEPPDRLLKMQLAALDEAPKARPRRTLRHPAQPTRRRCRHTPPSFFPQSPPRSETRRPPPIPGIKHPSPLGRGEMC